jgi:phospholipid/cholesterol/gamma-HCH transport system ATP-binding protein
MITITNLTKKFDGTTVLNNLTLTIPTGKMIAIVGKSGAGKSVLLKSIIGLLKPTSGSILIDDQEVTGLTEKGQELFYKKCGYVFQFAALLDSLTIFENVGLTLLEKGVPEKEVYPLVVEKLALVQLGTDILSRHPSDLSGGMRKRVGIARTLITNPSIILYDEPTTGLDPITSHVVHELLRSMQDRFHMTSVIISHDPEVFKVVDYVALLHEGSIKFFGEASEVWETENPYMYQFVRGLTKGPIQADL